MPRETGPLLVLVEDDPVMGQSVVDWMRVEGYRVVWLRTGAEALARLPGLGADVVVCDIRLPDLSGEDLYRELAPALGKTPILFVTGFGEIDQAVRLMKAGAADYVTKPFDIETLIEQIAALIAPSWQRTDGTVLGAAPAMVRVERILRRVADIDSTVLLAGPSGAGKEIAARFLHQVGPRAQRPFIAVNCAAIPLELIESEVFGHERGAFTGASGRHQGYCERALDGTLFLDEVAELPLSTQAKLLRLVQERVFSRVGGEEVIPFRARIVAATNADLSARVREGRFREDLHFRLDVISVAIPPLSARREDILPLARRFAGELSERFGRSVAGLTADAEAALLAHDFPGNVRELRNRIERGVALAEGPRLTTADLFPERATKVSESSATTLPTTLADARDALERRLIATALEEADGDAASAATRLGISRSTLFEKIRRLGVREM